MDTLTDLAREHLLLRLRPINRALGDAVERQNRATARLIRPDLNPLCVTADQVNTLLADVDALIRGHSVDSDLPETEPEDEEQSELGEPQNETSSSLFRPRRKQQNPPESSSDFKSWILPPTLRDSTQKSRELSSEAPGKLLPDELLEQEQLRARAAELNFNLPLDRLAREVGLSEFEEEALLLCAAPELDRSYERIYAYILDDLNRRYPCVELLCSLTAVTLAERLAHRQALGKFSCLRRTGMLQVFGDPPTELRQELRLALGLFEYLIGGMEDFAGSFRDPAEVIMPIPLVLPPQMNSADLDRLANGFAERFVSVLGLWGPPRAGHDDAVLAVAAKTGKPLRRFLLTDTTQASQISGKSITDAIQAAAALDAILWIATDPLNEPDNEKFGQILANELSVSHIPIILSGTHPWRPSKLLEMRPYAEIELQAPNYSSRQAMWTQALPEAEEAQLDDLSARFRIGGAEMRAAARMARTGALITGEGPDVSAGGRIERACATVARKRSHQFANIVTPKRGPKDLVLPLDLHNQVMEVAQFFRNWPRVAEHWGFGRMETGNGGVKALFTGDSGTGKTLAAEVIAGELGMPLLKVDLSRIISKWVGETEKHLEAAFQEAEDSHTVLFFDECDALFGKRGEVEHGVDRYANLEVSYLLQRLEYHEGLVILASNLKENIDKAFTRRFQVVVNFPRPKTLERIRIWEIAFPQDAPLEKEIDFETLARLDMTGAAIVGTARTAALLAVGENSPVINRSHLARAISRQFHRESRILAPGELGPYAAYLKEAK